MDQTFHDLGQIVLRGLPTFFLIIFLNFYLKAMFFKPLEETLKKRYDLTEGARIAAAEALANADKRIDDYESKLRAARSEMYAEQEKAHARLRDQQASALDAARRKSDEAVLRAKADLAAEKQTAFETLAAQSDLLADSIADRILVKGRAA